MKVFSFSRALTDKEQDTILDEITAIQKGDHKLRSLFIERHINYIASTAGRVKGGFIEKENDEEYPVALSAFNKAIDSYDPDRGASFFTFAGLLIKRDIIDLYRKSSRVQEIPMSQFQREDDDSEREWGCDDSSIRLQEDEFNLKQEISIYKTLLQEYAIDFSALASVSPKHSGVRQRMIRLANKLSEDKGARSHIINRKSLPLKEMEAWAGVSRKTLERHRKYILANFILVNSDLEYLKEFLKVALQGGEDE